MPDARRVALITGATHGVGLAFAREYALAHHNKDLILVGRSLATLQPLAEQLIAISGGRVEVVAADLNEPNAAAAVAAQVSALGMKVDVLVNAATARYRGSLLDLQPSTSQRQIALHCGAMVALCQAFAPQMVAQRFGSIINIAAAAGSRPQPYISVFGASKAFVLSFSQALRAELRPHGLRIVAVCPGRLEMDGAAAGGRAFGSVLITPMDVLVRRSLTAVRNNRATVTPGWQSQALAALLQLTPTRVFAALMRRSLQRAA